MFFLRRLRPLEVAGARVRSLRASLNAPVLSTADLPVGTARSLIIVHREARGGWDATVAVRSDRGGEIAYWSFDGELANDTDLDVASDAALTFAESLGFVFDEGAIGPGDEAEKLWRAWLGGQSPALANAADEGSGVSARRTAGDELELEETDAIPELELVDLEHEEAKAAPTRRAPANAAVPNKGSEAAPPKPLPKSLSKFRGRESGAAQNEAKGAARLPLARLQLVKRRSPEEERKLLLRKLLTSF